MILSVRKEECHTGSTEGKVPGALTPAMTFSLLMGFFIYHNFFPFCSQYKKFIPFILRNAMKEIQYLSALHVDYGVLKLVYCFSTLKSFPSFPK
ncbi:hypothetical protein CDAR_24291 [Caerostris darwini]|uniref:Uncharacterized protein n=1 Tax=Caerostris darwini TaxID=1538125 RepID=A0AAV4QFA8_9ARAC|nr:hypothetical protein CDAR_24291 [Caerostris darwini]